MCPKGGGTIFKPFFVSDGEGSESEIREFPVPTAKMGKARRSEFLAKPIFEVGEGDSNLPVENPHFSGAVALYGNRSAVDRRLYEPSAVSAALTSGLLEIDPENPRSYALGEALVGPRFKTHWVSASVSASGGRGLQHVLYEYTPVTY